MGRNFLTGPTNFKDMLQPVHYWTGGKEYDPLGMMGGQQAQAPGAAPNMGAAKTPGIQQFNPGQLAQALQMFGQFSGHGGQGGVGMTSAANSAMAMY